MITFKSDREVKTPEEIFNQISSRFIAATMMHMQFANYFDFLGMKGYKRLHEYQFFAESAEHREVSKYFINHHGKLLSDTFSGEVRVIPDSWYGANRLGVGKSTKQKAVEDSFLEYQTWEKETKTVYEKYAHTLRESGHISDALFVEKIISAVSEEVENIDRMISDLISTGYDMIYIMENQKEIYDKYKKMVKG